MQGRELQLAEKIGQGVIVRFSHLKFVGVIIHRRRRIDGHQLPAEIGLIFKIDQILLLLLFGDLLDPTIEVVQRAEGLDQGQGRLFADARHAGDVVGAVPGQGHGVNDLGRLDAEFFFDGSGIDMDLFQGVPDGDPIGDQLGEILVAGDDDHREPGRGRLPGQGADEVIGLEARHFQHGDAKGRDDLLDIGDLHGHVLGHGRPVGFIFLIYLMPKGRSPGVKQHHGVSRLPLLHEFEQHAGKGKGGVGRQAPRVGEAAHGMIAAVNIGGAVDQINKRFIRHRKTPGLRIALSNDQGQH